LSPGERFIYYSIPGYDSIGGALETLGKEIQSNKTLLENDCVLISKLNPRIPRVCHASISERGRTICSTEFIPLVPRNESVALEYLTHYLRSPVFQQRFQAAAGGSTNSHSRVTPGEILDWEVFAPPLPEQKKIAEILSGIDKTINKILEVIAKAETTLTGIFANLDLIASSGKTATLGEVVRVQNGYAFQSAIFSEDQSDIPLVRISNISGGVVDTSKSKRIPRTLAPSEEYKVNRGDILIAMSGATTGKIGKYQGDALCLLNQRVGKFVFHPESDSAAYASQLLLSGFLESRILAKAAGGAQPNISGKGIEDIDIPFPDAADQEKYGSVIKELLQVNSRRRILVEKHQNLKASISSDLLSGRKRVSEARILEGVGI
jgi:type I restriction enzyme S subunit